MSTAMKIIERKREIQECIKYLMKSVKTRLSAERIKNLSDGTSKKDYRFPFELQFDELPYTALYINLKTAVYDHLSHFVSGENKAFVPTNLKEFDTKPVPYCDIDLDTLDSALRDMEEDLLWSDVHRPVGAILLKLKDDWNQICDYVAKDGSLHCDEVEEDEDGTVCGVDLSPILEKNPWAIHWGGGVFETGVSDYCCVAGDELARAYLEAKGIAAKVDATTPKDQKSRDYVLRLISKSLFLKTCEPLNVVVDTLSFPPYKIPEEVILAILEQTLAGMKRVVFAKQLKILSDNKELSKGDLTKALGYSKDKFSACTALYGDLTIPEDELKAALRELGKPETLFNI